jgi:hypothetical protein
MEEKKKRELLHKVPMRKLAASIRKDLKRQIAVAAAGKPKKK